MIHRYQSTGVQDAYIQRFGISFRPAGDTTVSPGEHAVFVRRPRADHAGSLRPATAFEAASGRWGLIPLFSKDGLDPLFEAPAESAAAQRNFYQPWKRGHRCVVLVDALFEQDGEGGPLLRRSRADGRPLAVAGLWNGWRSPAGECVESFALLTVPLDGQRRQAALLHDAWVEDWLSCPVEETSAYLRPYLPASELVTQAVQAG